MGTRRYGYNQIRVHVHIIMDSKIPVYYTHEYLLSYPPRARDGFYPRISVSMGMFATPTCICFMAQILYPPNHIPP